MEGYLIKDFFVEAFSRASKAHGNLVALTGDFVKSMGLEEALEQKYIPHFSFGMATENMVSSAAGFVVGAKLPIVFAPSSVLLDAFANIRNEVCLPNLNVKFVGTMSGLTAGLNGPGFQSLDDLSLMRTLPSMKVLSPADFFDALSCFEECLLDYGPTFIRLPGNELPSVFDDRHNFEFGIVDVLKEGEEIVIFTTGRMTKRVSESLEIFEKNGFSVRHVNVTSINPIDEEGIVDCCEGVRACISVEDHGAVGGLGDAVSDVLLRKNPLPLLKICPDLAESDFADLQSLDKRFGLTSEAIFQRIKDFLSV